MIVIIYCYIVCFDGVFCFVLLFCFVLFWCFFNSSIKCAHLGVI